MPTTKSSVEVPHERLYFRQLLMANPNHFGQFPSRALKPKFPQLGTTDYEELGCVGFQPQFSLLEAIVYTKRSVGYGGGICSAGTPEYVRFYLSFDDGASWQDQGVTSFTAYDVPVKERLEYSVALTVSPRRIFCFRANLPRVRAILSWNQLPPPNAPDWQPVWGNVKEAHIQIAAASRISIGDILAEIEVKEPAQLAPILDLEQHVPVAEPKALSTTELFAHYEGKDVPGHRILFTELQQLAVQPAPSSESPTLPLPPPVVSSVDIDAVLAGLANTQGNTTYEQLDCIGFNPASDRLMGTLTVKLSAGYSGGPCTAGSREYVAFWVDWGDGAGFTYAGTTAVNVHDFNNLPKDGLHYAVFLPVNSLAHRQPCKKGPKTARVRAILSWQVAPPPWDPDYIPTWGNRQDTHILLQPGQHVPPGVHVPFLSSVGDMPEITINSGGTSNGTSIHTGFQAVDSPFGGRIDLAGHIANPVSGLKYRIMRKPHGAPDSAYVPMTREPDGVPLTLNTFAGGWVQTPITIHADVNGYYPWEDYGWDHSIESNILFYWDSTGAEDGKTYDLRIDVSVDANPANDLHSNVVTVLVDNTLPAAELDLTLGGECGEFHPGDAAAGHFSATDVHFKSFWFTILPSGPANGALPTVSAPFTTQLSNHYAGGAIPDPGASGGVWSLDTTYMKPCGYSLTINVADRTNVNSGASNHYSSASVGFCLRVPGT